MIKRLREQNRLNETLFMGILSIICFGFSIFRIVYTDTPVFMSLNWNLFLAFVPWFLTTIVIVRPKLQTNKLITLLLLIMWLLFFPNAPYILTDLFHLKEDLTMPLWFDLLLILSFAWSGLLFGFLSLWDIERILKRSFNKTWVTIISTCFLFLGSFGIYLGRYLRWNSWDVLREPFVMIKDVGDILINPIQNPRAWGMTLFMGLFLNMIYWTFKLIRIREE
jgi:uncharacterized membrane protein